MPHSRQELESELARILARLDSLNVELKIIGKRARAGKQAANKKQDRERIDEIRKQLGL